MNINLDKSTFYPSFPSLPYDDPASPYLSPLICTNSPFLSFAEDNASSFILED